MSNNTKNIKLISKPLTSIEFEQLNRARNDVFFFSQHIWVINPNKTGGRVPFNLYPFQKSVLWYFLTERFNIILKFRQAGVTELIAMYCLWLAMYHPNKTIVILSIKDRVAKKVLRKIKYMYRNLPDHLRVQVINGRGADIGTATEMEFSNGSIISSIPTTEDAGRSEALSLLVIDEAAIIRWANQIWAAAYPTLSTGGSAIVNSTPYGANGWFYKIWTDAMSGGNEFNPIRLRWQMHPERDLKWYLKEKRNMGPRRTAQEIDGNFLTSGNTVFDMLDIRAIEEEINDPTFSFTVHEKGLLKIFKKPEAGKEFFIGGDVSTGRSQDYSAFSIMDRFGEEYGAFKGKVSTGKLADLMMSWGKKYNFATIAPESNDVGLAVAEKIQESGYKRLFYATKFLKEKGDRRPKEEKIPGWYTTKKNRPVIIDQLEEDIREKDIIIRSEAFCKEAYNFIYDSSNRPVAKGKGNKNNEEEDSLSDETFSDDAIMATAITNQIRKGKHKGPRVLPR